MKRRNHIGVILVIFIISIAFILLAACGSGASEEPENDSADSLSILTGILIEASSNTITIQSPDGTTYMFGVDGNTIIEGSEYLGNTLSVSFFGEYTSGIIAVSIKTIVQVDHDATPDKGYITEPDAPQPREPAPEDETIWYMTGTVVDISENSLHLLYEDGKTYTVLFDENTKKDSGIVAGCVARVFRKGSLRDGMLAIEVHYIAAAPTPKPSPTPTPAPTPPPADVPPGDIIQYAKSLVGTAYKSGGANPMDGFDNSGFIYYVLNQNGIKCPRTIHEQVSIGPHVSDYDSLSAGDLVFFGDGSGSGTATYGGIYAGGGTMIYSSSSAGTVTQSDINQQWYKDVFVFGVKVG